MPDTDHRLQDARQFSPTAARNCVPIREVLTRVLPKKGLVLEIGSGTGEHVVCFAKALPRLVWLPSDPDGASLASIEAWMTSEGLTNVSAPVSIDVREKVWGVEGDAPFDAILSLNMIHIRNPAGVAYSGRLAVPAGQSRRRNPDPGFAHYRVEFSRRHHRELLGRDQRLWTGENRRAALRGPLPALPRHSKPNLRVAGA